MAAFKVIRLLSDILEHRENIPGILVSIDFGKVFDLLERSRIHCTLQLLILVRVLDIGSEFFLH